MRFDSPALPLGRRIVKRVEWHGRRMESGQAILFAFQSGNRDERVIEEPDRFEVRRGSIRHLAFGSGIHACIGLHYARLESRLMLDQILERAPEYEIARARRARRRRGDARLPLAADLVPTGGAQRLEACVEAQPASSGAPITGAVVSQKV